jgi:hypothetical protein
VAFEGKPARCQPPWPEPYIVIDGRLDECIKKFLLIPIIQHHLYEIRTAPQGELVAAVMRGGSFVKYPG